MIQQPFIRVETVTDGTPQVRFVSGGSIYDEAVIDGALVSRYFSSTGQIRPPMYLEDGHYGRENEQFDTCSFVLTVGGQRLSGFSFQGFSEREDTTGLRGAARVCATRLSHPCGIEVAVCTRLDGGPFFVRWLEVTNASGAALGIDSVYPFAGRIWSHTVSTPSGYEVCGDAGVPYAVAFCHSTDWGTEGDFWFERVPDGELRFDGGHNGKSGWSRPAYWLRDNTSGHTLVCEFAYSGNWELRARSALRDGVCRLGHALGIPSIEGEYIRVLGPGETAVTPAVHFGLFCCTDDGITQALHRHVRCTVMPARPEGREIEIESNHRGYHCDRESDEGIRRDIDVAAMIGTELYVIDAGWYGRPPNQWWNNVGDWHTAPWLPGGLRAIADYAHGKGMRFGLWVEIEACGANAKLREDHPEWLMRREGEPLPEGARALDLSLPAVRDWVERDVVCRCIEEYGLDMFRIDHNHNIGRGGLRTVFGLRENILWRYYDNLYAIFDRARARYPQVVFQNCAGGGGRMDLGILQRFHNTELSDWMRPPRQVKIYGGMTMTLPPEFLLRTFGTETPELEREPDLDFQLNMVSVCRPIFRGIAPTPEELYPYLKEKINSKLKLYKEFLRPALQGCRMYHHTPFQRMFEPADFGVFEYAGENGRSFAALFRLDMTKSDPYRLYPRSLRRDRIYRVGYTSAGETVERCGAELIGGGLLLFFHASEIVTFEEIG